MEKNKKRFKPGEIYWEIIKLIGMAYISGGGSTYRPLLPQLIQEIIRLIKESRDIEVKEKKVKTTLLKLEKRQIINLVEESDKIFVEIKSKKKSIILKYSIKSIFDFKKKQKNWDGQWYLVFFDVPEIQRNKRNYLRMFLNKLGFYKFQKSVYIYPYSCEKEINLIKAIVEGGKYIKYIVAKKIEDEENIKRYFHIN
ncbi:MAG: Transcriptional regulator, PaaX family [Candidatus Roizmanbacteria bacterium GW2011_GWA2_35_8]|uniref:Transcriptional regulator, PaaX family n=1 Tax=Candidatus Roizmanbacteria bacterium GW2011_GWA2_35_8 TaxID=1618479 RepID=A0A0G0CWW3_9BACT|nr:MAG: Transcriptional regulator, PaaX family [Candidatus Roizmanbacteria bacterium GW2011_GWA2_35_8]